MKSRLFIFPLLAFSLALPCTSANAQPTYKPLAPADFKVPEAEMQKWAARLKKLCPSDEWEVTVEGNDMLLVRKKSVQTNQQLSRAILNNLQITSRLTFLYKARLRFSPLITLDKYDELEAVNVASSVEDSSLLMKYKLPKYTKENWGFSLNPDFGARKQGYLEESKKLVFHQLPHFYCADYSLTVYRSPFLSNLRWNNAALVDESKRLEAAISGYFGNYQPNLATELPFYPDDDLTKSN